MKDKKKKKKYSEDDGHTIVDMDIEGTKWHTGKKKNKVVQVSFKERMALIWGAYCHMLPAFLMAFGCFFVAMLLMMLWMSC